MTHFHFGAHVIGLSYSLPLAIGYTNSPDWLPASDQWIHELAVSGDVVIAGVLLFIPLRRLIYRARLGTAYVVLMFSLAIYLAIAVMEPQRIHHGNDPFVWWLNRVFAGALLFVAVRSFDRLLLVPVLSRGGTVTVPRFIRQIILIGVSIFVLLMYGKQAFGWPINDFLTGGAVISVVIGLALQESLGNLFSGLFMQAAPPFVPGDFIAVGGTEGRVVDMTWRAVTIQTLYDNFVVIPNGLVAKQEILNYHAPDSVTAKLVKVGLEYDLPPCDAIEVLEKVARETEGVLTAPAPKALMLDFTDSSILYGIKFWISEPHRHLKIEHEVRMNLWYRLKEKGYEIPFPVRTVEHVNVSARRREQSQQAASDRLATFDQIALLAPLSDQQRRQLADSAATVQLAPGQVLFSQDEPGASLYIIHRGKAEVVVKGAGNSTSVVAVLGPGEIVGEMSALTGQPRSATIRAASAVSLVEISKPELQAIVDADASILEKLSAIIARRNVERDAHLKGLVDSAAYSEKLNSQQQSLLGRMAAFFRKTKT